MAREPIKLPLSEAVNSYGDMISELLLSPPKGKDILECGYPWSLETNARTGGTTESVNVPAIRLLLSRMAGVPESTIDQLHAVDFYQAVEAVRFFFRYIIRDTSSTSTLPSGDGPGTNPSSLN